MMRTRVPRRTPRSRLLTALLTLPLVAGLMVALAAPANAVGPVIRAFTAVRTINTTGDIILTGNTLLTCPAGSSSGAAAGASPPPPSPAISCAAAQGAGSSGADNWFNMAMVDVDGDSSTFNSSSATVTVPAGATVLYAALSWGATTAAGTNGVAAPTAASKGIVKFKPPSGEYITETAATTDTSSSIYQGFADVTSVVAAGGSGSYTVGNVQTGTGVDRYAGWSLAIAYQDPTQPTRNLVIYTGFAVLGSGSTVNVPISGFKTPATGSVVTRLGAVTYEGDRAIGGDSLSLNSTKMSNTLNPATDIFNSTISDLGVATSDRNPSYANTLGLDVDRFDATGVLANGATTATVTFASTNETYYPGLLTFATNIYAPSLTATKTVSDRNGGNVSPGDLLDYSIGVTNTGGDGSTVSTLTDAAPAGTTYVPGSLTIGGTAVTDATGDDTGTVSGQNITARIGTGATATAGGALAPNDSTTVAFQVSVNAADTDGQAITNAANLTYNGQTTGSAFTGSSNTVTSSVVVPPTLTFAAPPAGQVGAAYSDQLTKSGGTGPFVWSVSSGTLPAGLTLNSSTGLLSGTPTTAGSTPFTVMVTDANSRTDTKAVTFAVDQATNTVSLTSTTASLHLGSSVTFTATVAPSNATGDVTFTVVPTTGPLSGSTVTLGTGTISDGVATLTVPMASYGTNPVSASYSGDGNNIGADSSALAVEVNAAVGDLIVKEFRQSGPSGAADQYVELYNASAGSIPLGGLTITSSSGAVVTLPMGSRSVPPGQSYLVTGGSYSLGSVGHSNASAASLGTVV